MADRGRVLRIAIARLQAYLDRDEYSCEYETCRQFEAVTRGLEQAGSGGVVLLAPACASFDWFADYAERGRAFKEEVEELRKRMT